MPLSPVERILRRLDVDSEGCWIWLGEKTRKGYGRMTVGSRTDGSRRNASTHRVMYEAFIGPIADGLQIDHLCRKKGCCNPDHLEAVTAQVNYLRAIGASRTHCKRGHEFTPENTGKQGAAAGGGRKCLACARMHAVRYYQAKKSKAA